MSVKTNVNVPDEAGTVERYALLRFDVVGRRTGSTLFAGRSGNPPGTFPDLERSLSVVFTEDRPSIIGGDSDV